MHIINSKHSFFYNHLRHSLERWKKENPNKRPFVSIKIFEFDESKMKINYKTEENKVKRKPSEVHIEEKPIRRLESSKVSSTKILNKFVEEEFKLDAGGTRKVDVKYKVSTKIKIENMFSVLAFEDDKDEELDYIVDTYDDANIVGCNLLEINQPLVMKPKRITDLPGDEYYFNSPENKIDNESLNRMVDCPIFRVAEKIKPSVREFGVNTELTMCDMNDNLLFTNTIGTNTELSLDGKFINTHDSDYLETNQTTGLGFYVRPDYLSILSDNISMSKQLNMLLSKT